MLFRNKVIIASPVGNAAQTPNRIAAIGGRRFTLTAIFDASIFILVAAFTLLRGCREMADNDLWWHLRAGEWILSEGRIPLTDPFSFGSADRLWIDLHWGFQVVLALVYRWQGVPGTVLVSAAAATLAVTCCWLSGGRRLPAAIGAGCWLPSIWLLGSRVGPRPEVFSMLFIAAFLTVLNLARSRPRLLWLLPALQAIWVNFHALFVFGPFLLGAYLIDAVWTAFSGRRRGDAMTAEDRRSLQRIAAVLAATCCVCLANPYFVDGALLPFELLPKVSQEGNLYKEAINEFRSPARYLATSRLAGPRGEWNLHAEYFLLLALPLSFFLPAIWQALQAPAGEVKRPSKKPLDPQLPPSRNWQIGAAGAALAIVLAADANLPGHAAPFWTEAIAAAFPVCMLLLSAMAYRTLTSHSPSAARLSLFSGAAMALWLLWAPELLFGATYAPGIGSFVSPMLPLLTPLAAIPAAMLALRSGGSLFRMLVAAAFAYLSLQAVRNMALFALVGGAVLAWNFGEWGAAVTSRSLGASRGIVGWVARGSTLVVLLLAIAGLISKRLYRWSGQPELRVAVGEAPFVAPHDAARFAGQDDLPRRALTYDLGLASVYLFHNSPTCKPYIDPRLELPDVEAFDNYLSIDEWLNARDPRWRTALRRLGDPMVMLEHREHYVAEAELYRQSDWRCVYYDALVSIFVPRRATSRPSVDFAGLHFANSRAPSIPALPGAALREGVALSNLGATLRRISGNEHAEQLAFALRALDRLQMAVDAKAWTVLGDCYRNLVRPGAQSTLVERSGWRIDPDLFWAQATYSYRRALELDSENAAAWERLYDSLQARRLIDFPRGVGVPMSGLDAGPQARAAEIERLRRSFAPLLEGEFHAERPEGFGPITWLLQKNEADAASDAIATHEKAMVGSSEWAWADQLATALMHLGRPEQARRIWRAAVHPPSEAVRFCRVAASFAVQGDEQESLQLYRRAAALEPALAEPCLGLAYLHLLAGRAEPARDACRQAFQRELSDDQREHLQSFARLLDRQSGESSSHE